MDSIQNYTNISWPLFSDWPLVRFATPMDGNCFFHAIANGFFEPYRSQSLNGTPISRNQLIMSLRKELSEKLSTKREGSDKTYYDTLNRGNLKEFSTAVPEFSLQHMQKELISSNPIGYGYLEFVGNALNKDIYILEARRQDIYVTDELSLTIQGNRTSLVLYYIDGHYELLGIKKTRTDGSLSFVTYFTPDHPLITFLYQRIQDLILHKK